MAFAPSLRSLCDPKYTDYFCIGTTSKGARCRKPANGRDQNFANQLRQCCEVDWARQRVILGSIAKCLACNGNFGGNYYHKNQYQNAVYSWEHEITLAGGFTNIWNAVRVSSLEPVRSSSPFTGYTSWLTNQSASDHAVPNNTSSYTSASYSSVENQASVSEVSLISSSASSETSSIFSEAAFDSSHETIPGLDSSSEEEKQEEDGVEVESKDEEAEDEDEEEEGQAEVQQPEGEAPTETDVGEEIEQENQNEDATSSPSGEAISPIPDGSITPSSNTTEPNQLRLDSREFIPYYPSGNDAYKEVLNLLQRPLTPGDLPGSLYIFMRASSLGFFKIGRTYRSITLRIKEWMARCRYVPNCILGGPQRILNFHKRAEALVHAILSPFRRREISCNKGAGCGATSDSRSTGHCEWFETSSSHASDSLDIVSNFMEREPYDPETRMLRPEWRSHLLSLPKDLVLSAFKAWFEAGPCSAAQLNTAANVLFRPTTPTPVPARNPPTKQANAIVNSPAPTTRRVIRSHNPLSLILPTLSASRRAATFPTAAPVHQVSPVAQPIRSIYTSVSGPEALDSYSPPSSPSDRSFIPSSPPRIFSSPASVASSPPSSPPQRPSSPILETECAEPEPLPELQLEINRNFTDSAAQQGPAATFPAEPWRQEIALLRGEVAKLTMQMAALTSALVAAGGGSIVLPVQTSPEVVVS